MLAPYLIPDRREAGCDEAGRGPLAGPVVAAAVILPPDYANAALNDSKQLNERQRNLLREEIEREAMDWAVAVVSAEEIDRLNILHASTHAMCLAVKALKEKPEFLLIDGNRFYNETDIPYQCIVKGDAKLMPIAAASILAKTHRDEIMTRLHEEYPHYGWNHNKGYPTEEHYRAIEEHGPTPYHRRSFTLYKQHSLFE
ncbi:MAG: ribonuclease HII [Bacteroidales bacterium]|nr:ribonuclease HII [Bacteroidales bacterium]